MAAVPFNATGPFVGFGTAALAGNSYGIVTMALQAGFRRFDTAEADYWYDQPEVGRALHDFFQDCTDDDDTACACDDLKISTKIPPWSLFSASEIRNNAAHSRRQLVGFCEDQVVLDADGIILDSMPYPLDVYFIHAPECWPGWHPRCENAPRALPLREAWMAMEAVVGLDHSAERIGLSNVHPPQLLDIIHFVKERQEQGGSHMYPPPRMPDAVQIYSDPIQPNEELRRICQDHGIEFVSYSTLGTQHRNVAKNPVLTHPTVVGLAAKHSRSVAEVVLSWALQKGMSVIPRSTKEKHIQELARLLKEEYSNFLDDADLAMMDGLSQARTT